MAQSIEVDGQNLEDTIRQSLDAGESGMVVNQNHDEIEAEISTKSYVVNGSGNRIRLQGECESLVVNGINNQVWVTKVDSISIPGANNHVYYESGMTAAKPRTVSILGGGSSAAQGRVPAGGASGASGSTAQKNTADPSESAAQEDTAGASESKAQKTAGASGGSAIAISINNQLAYERSIKPGSRVKFSGSNNLVTLEGEAASLSVQGSNNRIEIDAVGQVEIDGNNNAITYKRRLSSGAPAVRQRGSDNLVGQQ
jgi:Protein of unknown function (DUF3060)